MLSLWAGLAKEWDATHHMTQGIAVAEFNAFSFGSRGPDDVVRAQFSGASGQVGFGCAVLAVADFPHSEDTAVGGGVNVRGRPVAGLFLLELAGQPF